MENKKEKHKETDRWKSTSGGRKSGKTVKRSDRKVEE